MFDARLYPADWRSRRRERLQAAGHRCEECGASHRSVQKNAHTGEDYMIYLSIAHKKQYQTWMKEAETMVLCQRCHRRYDRRFRRKAGARTYTPISYVSVFVVQDGDQLLVGDARSYDDLREMVAALPDGAFFLVQMIMHGAVVGNGQYHKQADGLVMVVGEYGACANLSVQLPTREQVLAHKASRVVQTPHQVVAACAREGLYLRQEIEYRVVQDGENPTGFSKISDAELLRNAKIRGVVSGSAMIIPAHEMDTRLYTVDRMSSLLEPHERQGLDGLPIGREETLTLLKRRGAVPPDAISLVAFVANPPWQRADAWRSGPVYSGL